MKQIELVFDNGDAYTKYSAFDDCDKKYVPVVFIMNKKKNFVFNAVTEVYNDRGYYGKRRIEELKMEVEEFKNQLCKNDGKYICFNSKHKDIWQFLKWVKDSGYSFVNFSSFCIWHGFYEFHGNLKEYSCAFHYRIYDRKLYNNLRKSLPDVQVEDYTKAGGPSNG